ncbi:Beta-2-microglobulin [Crenichthys baileyi]|uniref:Beta-2-microglobulin n=1 Tax=Crenichthys baileyi TaxID=28760 RepID=A0AAV9QSQ8_9TELE
MAKVASPKVQIYSRNPGNFGTENVLICHVSGFHPPEIKIDLLKNQGEIPGAKQTDLAFEENWHYHLTKHVSFTPNSGEKYVCRVTHVGKTTDYVWEADI